MNNKERLSILGSAFMRWAVIGAVIHITFMIVTVYIEVSK